MSDILDYPGDSPTGPQATVPPAQPGYAFRPGAQLPPQPPQQQAFRPRPSRLNKVAASVCIAAGALVIVAVLFGGGFYLGRETAPQPRPDERNASRVEQGGPLVIPMPRSPFEQPGPGIVIPNGPTIQLPNIFPQLPSEPGLPTFPQVPSSPTPGKPPR